MTVSKASFENQYEKCPTCRLECDYCKNNIEHNTCTWTKNWHSDNCEICILISDKLFEKTLNLLMFIAFVMFCYGIGTVLRRMCLRKMLLCNLF